MLTDPEVWDCVFPVVAAVCIAAMLCGVVIVALINMDDAESTFSGRLNAATENHGKVTIKGTVYEVGTPESYYKTEGYSYNPLTGSYLPSKYLFAKYTVCMEKESVVLKYYTASSSSKSVDNVTWVLGNVKYFQKSDVTVISYIKGGSVHTWYCG